LIFAPGYFNGTPLVNTSRLSVGAKSPPDRRHQRKQCGEKAFDF
jgi:aldehyde:ferredoxin oxidoreductase